MSTSTHDPQALLRRLEWTVLKRLDGLLHGDYRSLFRGFGLDLADLREYQFNDDVRHIDWNVTARMQTPYVREFHEDREVCAWFVVDLSASVAFGSGKTGKRDIATDFVAIMARLLARHGNAVGLISHDGTANTLLPPRTGRRHLLQLISQLQKAQGERAGGQMTDLSVPLQAGWNAISRRSVVFVVSDFFSAPGWAEPLARLARRHDVVAVRVHDPLESSLPDLGLVTIQDAETGEQLLLDTHDRKIRDRFAQLASKREETMRRLLGQAGVDAMEVSTQDDLAETLLRFSALRQLRSRIAAGSPIGAHLIVRSGLAA